MAKNKDPKDMTPEELAMYNEILDLERQSKEKELQAIEKKKQKELKKLDKAQAKINGVLFEDEKSKIKKVEEPVEEVQKQPIVSNITNTLNKDDITFDKLLINYLKDIDPHQKKVRLLALIENIYSASMDKKSKEYLRASFFMVERIAGRPGLNNNATIDEKEDTLVNEIHALTNAIKTKSISDKEEE